MKNLLDKLEKKYFNRKLYCRYYNERQCYQEFIKDIRELKLALSLIEEKEKKMCLDYTFCVRECEDMMCKHNKKHLEELEIGGKKVVTAISWSDFTFCTKGEPYDPRRR